VAQSLELATPALGPVRIGFDWGTRDASLRARSSRFQVGFRFGFGFGPFGPGSGSGRPATGSGAGDRVPLRRPVTATFALPAHRSDGHTN
jgi:hypothetical protein